MSYISSLALSVQSTMLMKPAEHLRKGCMNTKHQSRKMDSQHQFHAILRMMDTDTNIGSSLC